MRAKHQLCAWMNADGKHRAAVHFVHLESTPPDVRCLPCAESRPRTEALRRAGESTQVDFVSSLRRIHSLCRDCVSARNAPAPAMPRPGNHETPSHAIRSFPPAGPAAERHLRPGENLPKGHDRTPSGRGRGGRNLAPWMAYEARARQARNLRKMHGETVDAAPGAAYHVRPRLVGIMHQPEISRFEDVDRSTVCTKGPARMQPGTGSHVRGDGTDRARRLHTRVGICIAHAEPPPDAPDAPGGFVSPRQTFCRNRTVRA